MAEATALRNNATIFPVYGLPFTIVIPILDADGDPVTGATGLDSEISLNGDTPADCTNEATEIGTSGEYYLSLTAAEMTADIISGVTKTSSTGAKTTPWVLYPRKLAVLLTSDNAGAYDSTTTINLGAGASAIDDFYVGCLVYIYGGTGNGQVRMITDYVGSTKLATVHVAWATNPDATSDLRIYRTEQAPYVLDANMTRIIGATQSATDLRDFADTGYDPATHKVETVKLADVVTTYTGNTPQTGDSYAIVNNVTYGNSAIENLVDDLESRLTAARAGYLDYLNTINSKLPNDYIAGSSVQTALDGIINSILSYVSNIAVTGSPAYQAVASYTLTTGNQTSGTYASTDTANNTYHVHTDQAGVLDLYYDYTLRSDEQAVQLILKGRIMSSNDSVYVQIYDWTTSAYVTLTTLAGTNTTTDSNLTWSLVSKYTGTGVNIGKVRVRFVNAVALTTATLYIDQLVLGKTNTSRSVGYVNGAIWVDTIAGEAGTTEYANGVADNPVLTFADAVTIATSLGLRRFEMVSGSVITFAAARERYSMRGDLWYFTPAGYSIDYSYINGALIGAIAPTSFVADHNVIFENCSIWQVTLDNCFGERCTLRGKITIASGATCFFRSPTTLCQFDDFIDIDFNLNGNSAFGLVNADCSVEIIKMAAGDTLYFAGRGRIQIDADCTGGTVYLCGNIAVTDNSGGAVTRIETTRFAIDRILSDQVAFAGANIAAIKTNTDTITPGGDATAANQTTIINHLTGIKGATFDTLTDSLEAIRNRGDVAWLTGGGLSGSSTVILTVQTSGFIPISEFNVEIWDTGLTALQGKYSTNASGQVTFTCNDGTYGVKLSKSGYTITSPTTLTVIGNTNQTFTATAISIGAPVTAGVCRVYDYCFDIDGSTPLESVEATAQINALPYDSGNMLHTSEALSGIYDSNTGIVYWDIVYGAEVKFVIKECGLDKTKTIPSSASARLIDI